MNEPRYFCLRGFMKSGTNWLGSLLASHENISCIGEFHWQHMVRELNKALKTHPVYQKEHKPKQKIVRDHFEAMIKETLKAYAEPNSTLIGERTPHTIEPVMIRGVPQIVIVRDGRDVVVSRAFHMFNWPGSHRMFERIPELKKTLTAFQNDPWFFKNNPQELLANESMVRESAGWWKDHVQKDAGAQEKFPSLPIRIVRYEDLHKDVEGERKKLFEFLDVDPARCAKISGVLSPGFKEERPAEFLRKGAIGDWTNYFTDESKKWFNTAAGEELQNQQYVDSANW